MLSVSFDTFVCICFIIMGIYTGSSKIIPKICYDFSRSRSRSPVFKPFDTFSCSIKSSSWSLKFEMVQSLTGKIRKFEGLFNLADQSQGHQF